MEQFVRVCRYHGRVLDGQDCPVGPHHATEWLVVDRTKSVALSEAHEQHGERRMLRSRLQEAPGRVASKARTKEPGEEERPMSIKPDAPESPTPTLTGMKSGLLKTTPFTGPAGKLTVRLLRRKNGKFQVGWTLKPTAGKKGAGLLYEGEDRGQAYDAYGRALQDARAMSWQEPTPYTPIPSAGLAAAPKGRNRVAGSSSVRAAVAKPTRAVRKCGKCRKPGHRRETCSEKLTNKPAGKRGAQAA